MRSPWALAGNDGTELRGRIVLDDVDVGSLRRELRRCRGHEHGVLDALEHEAHADEPPGPEAVVRVRDRRAEADRAASRLHRVVEERELTRARLAGAGARRVSTWSPPSFVPGPAPFAPCPGSFAPSPGTFVFGSIPFASGRGSFDPEPGSSDLGLGSLGTEPDPFESGSRTSTSSVPASMCFCTEVSSFSGIVNSA
jgi:hypothetical protein